VIVEEDEGEKELEEMIMTCKKKKGGDIRVYIGRRGEVEASGTGA
jgi:hypothetical protein